MMKKIYTILQFLALSWILCLLSYCNPASDHTETNDSVNLATNQLDMLTPAYYQAENPMIAFLDTFLSHAQAIEFHHPLMDESGNIPSYHIAAFGFFGAQKGPDGAAQHHPAIDLHVGTRQSTVNLYATCSGWVHTERDADKYRHFISITRDILDFQGKLLGKLVVIYGHVDLDLDYADGFDLDGQYVQQGELISRHLYASTVGGPHLHFEIRYYRESDSGLETFYGSRTSINPDLTIPSAGQWEYGYWHPDIGYGFAHPLSHGLDFESGEN